MRSPRFKTTPLANPTRPCFSTPQIRGLNKKGKEFFRFNTQLTETIRRVDIFGKNIWSAGEYVHNHFIEGKDKALYLCPDRINAAEVGAWRRVGSQTSAWAEAHVRDGVGRAA